MLSHTVLYWEMQTHTSNGAQIWSSVTCESLDAARVRSQYSLRYKLPHYSFDGGRVSLLCSTIKLSERSTTETDGRERVPELGGMVVRASSFRSAAMFVFRA